MKRGLLYAVLLTLGIIYACTDNKDGQNNYKEKYTSEEIGWTIKVPWGFNITAKNEINRSDPVGEQAIKKAKGKELDFSEVKKLICFQKNEYNIFQSTLEPTALNEFEAWEKSYEEMKELLYKTYRNEGVNLDTSSSTTIIDSLEFRVFHLKIKDFNGNIMLFQDLYNRYIDGYDFGVSISYNNNEDKAKMVGAWKNSEFSTIQK